MVENSEKIRTGLPRSGHTILEVSIPILLLVKSIVIDVERSLKGDRQGAPPKLGFCVYLFFFGNDGASPPPSALTLFSRKSIILYHKN